MPRACAICTFPDQAAVRSAFAAGGTDREIGRQFGVSHMSAGRHRRAHLVAPLRAATAALDRGRAVRQQREDQLAAAEAGDPSAFLALAAIVADLRKVHERLDGAASQAADAGQHAGHAALAGQLLRGAELRGRWGGHDKSARTGGGEGQFAVNITFSSGAIETITACARAPTIEGARAQPDGDEEDEGPA